MIDRGGKLKTGNHPHVVTFFSLKGGQGKTTLAVNYARYIGSAAAFVTNDIDSGTYDWYQYHIPAERWYILDDGDEVEDKIVQAVTDGAKRVVCDFGGYRDKRIQEAIRVSDVVVVPIVWDSRVDMGGLLKSLERVEKCDQKNIIIALNKGDKKTRDEAEEAITAVYGEKYEIVVIPKSSYVDDLIDPEQMFGVIQRPHGATGKWLDQLLGQFDVLFGAIEAKILEGDKPNVQ